MLRFFKRLFLPKAFNFSISINGTLDEVFNGIKNTSNWYLFDFHDLIYLYNDKVLVTQYGRGTLKMKCDAANRQVVYSIENDMEGVWKFEICILEDAGSAVLNLKCWGPRKISYETFYRRSGDLVSQLGHFKNLVEAKKRMN